MSNNRREDGETYALSLLEARLRQLGRVEPPAGLREKLAAAVPHEAAGQAGNVAVPRWSRVFHYLGAAAIIVIMASVLFQRFVPPVRSPRPARDINDLSVAAATTDHNSLRPRDMNVCDNNAVP